MDQKEIAICKNCKFCIQWANGEGADCVWRPPAAIKKAIEYDSARIYKTGLNDTCSMFTSNGN